MEIRLCKCCRLGSCEESAADVRGGHEACVDTYVDQRRDHIFLRFSPTSDPTLCY